MRALTVQQPWAWAIVHGGKDVENRTQAWSYRGPLAIHAGARWSKRGQESELIRSATASDIRPGSPFERWHTPGDWGHMPSLTFGAVIGVVDLVAVHVAADGCCDSPWGEREYGNGHPDFDRPRRRDIVHLEVANPRPLTTPIPAKGRLGLWTPAPDLLAQIREQVPA